MLALVTQADGTSRGQPWVSYLLALMLLGGFVSTQLGEARERRLSLEAGMADLVVTWQENPYLELDERLVDRVGDSEQIVELRDAWLAERRARGLSVMSDRLKRRAQARFDERVHATFAGITDLPAWRHGVVDRSSPLATWVTHFAFPDTAASLAVGLLFTLCLGIALEGAWGPWLFAPFAGTAIVLGGMLYSALHGELGHPWVGASGLTAALLGAYCVQAIRWPARLLGAIAMPVWLMLPLWIGLEGIAVRGLRTPELDGLPVSAAVALFAFGLVAGGVARSFQVEDRRKARDEKASEVMANPVLDRAMSAHEKGRSDEAFEMLRAEMERQPKHRDLAIALWTVASSLGRTAEAVPSFVDVVRDDLKRRRNDEALAHWKELAPALGATEMEPGVLVRLGELLLDAGEPDQAISTLGMAVDGGRPLASPLAIRAVRVARDLDPGLTARAAARALEDRQLDPGHRAEFEALSSDIRSAVEAPPPADPHETPTEVDLGEAGATPAAQASPPTADGLDPAALSLDQLSQDLSEGLDGDAAPEGDAALERWNDPGQVEDLSAELADDGPVLDAPGAPAGDAYDPTAYGSVNLGSDDEITQPEVPPAATVAAQATEAAESIEPLEADVDLGETGRRRLKLLEAAPLELGAQAIKLEVVGRGKTTLPFDRIDALAVSTVGGLSERPVLVLDLVMNWISMDGESLKVIRLRSDRFNPSKLVPDAESPMAALKSLLARLLEQSGATPLPDGSAVRGAPFARHADLDAYHRDVLMVDGVEA